MGRLRSRRKRQGHYRYEVIPVDLFMPGCPPSADLIRKTLEAFRNGNIPEYKGREIKFG